MKNGSSQRFFNRIIDSGAYDTTEEYNDSNSGPRYGRRTVPYVNERREFDPRYDPRNPATLKQYECNGSELDSSNNPFATKTDHQSEEIVFEDQRNIRDLYSQRTRRSLFSNRVSNYISQRGEKTETKPRNDSDFTQQSGLGLFQENDSVIGLFDRPFDEQSDRRAGSATGTDSLEEIMQQESLTSSTETSEGDGRLDIVLSAIEERPSLEAGSLSYSLTQINASQSAISYGDPALGSVGSCGHPDPALGYMSSPESVPSYYSDECHEDPVEQDTRHKKSIYRIDSSTNRKPPPPANSQDSGIVDLSAPFPGTETQSSSLNRQSASQTLYYTFGDNTETQLRETKKELSMQQEPEGRNEKSEPSPSRETKRESSNSSHSSWNSPLGADSPSTATSAQSSIHAPSDTGRAETEKLVRDLDPSRRLVKDECSDKQLGKNHQMSPETSKSATEDETDTLNTENQDLTLHDLCGEANSTDDVAWRNALYLLSMQPNFAYVSDSAGWTPLHVSCLGSTPPPAFVTRSLLYVNHGAAKRVDGGGRLPLHLIAASSGDPETMQLLVDEYPEAIYQPDCQGWTPLHLLLKNFSVNITLEQCRVLLGLTITKKIQTKTSNLLQRRGDHLNAQVEELGQFIRKKTPVTRLNQEQIHEAAFLSYPGDVQASLRRLYQWKRKQHRLKEEIDREDDARAASSMDVETNPAASCSPTKQQLPLHVIVKRGLSDGSARHRLCNDNYDTEEANTATSYFLKMVRLFIAIYPESLLVQDTNGYTPLMIALMVNNTQAPEELVELLLGKKTVGFDCLPEWACNMPLYSFSANSGRYLNPAMVPIESSQKLPLHVVAEEYASCYSMLSAVHESYPGAIHVQDARGRTPLHILLRNHRHAPLDPHLVTLLLSEKVAMTFDDEGKLPFDLLLEGASNIPPEHPEDTNETTNDTKTAFKTFFQGTLVASSKPQAKNRFKSGLFLRRLRLLPSWLRQQACFSPSVQEMIIEEIASPLKCACIMLYAMLLILLIAFFHKEMEAFTEAPSGSLTLSSISLIVYALAFGVSLFHLVFWCLSVSMSSFLSMCVFNMWRLADLASILLTVSTTVMITNDSDSKEVVLRTGTAAIGMLWLSFVGFICSWWYKAALFSAVIQRIAKMMLWPMVVALVLVVGFAEMFYTMAHINCDTALGELALCSVRDSYTLIYFLTVGEPIVDIGGEQIATTISILSVLFIGLFSLLIFSSFAMALQSTWDFEEMAVKCFWEPTLTYISSTANWRIASGTTNRFENAWTIAVHILTIKTGTKGTYWYACFSKKSILLKLCLWLFTALIVPIWLALGVVTLGLLWPPQVRRYLFQPCRCNFRRSSSHQMSSSAAEVCNAQVSKLRNEIAQVRDMSYEKTNDIQGDIKELKEILCSAISE